MAQGLLGSVFAAYGGLRVAQKVQEETLREPRILFYAFLSGFLLFLAGLPTARMQASLIDDPNALAIVLAARFFGALFILPLAFYALAAVAHIAARALGGAGTFQTSRLSLFWALLVTMPVLILASILAVVLVTFTGLPMNVLGLIVLLAFAKIWGEGLAQAEGFARAWPASLAIAAIPLISFITIAGIQK